ncbi:ankyrin repeat domain-containing protein [Streptomyces sp. NPDC098789]|uniref:ankyrin repeat domain-containing protein n=1 Tax=Streptomyces sp. NPDC098789 TaxID=3366098 RepID=UPI0038178D21
MNGAPANLWTPAHQAVESSDHAVLTRLLHEGADVNEVCCGMTLLMHAIDLEGDSAVQSGRPIDSALTAVLLAYGADPSVAINGETALDWAHEYGHDMAVRLLNKFAPQESPAAGSRPRSGLSWRRSRRD